jgi:RNA polymerase sigma-70 factor (ECF subfamily)
VEARIRELFAHAAGIGAERFEAVAVEMYRAYRGDVERLSRQKVPNARIDDVCSATWADVPKALASFKGDSSFHAWLFRIATNKANDELRRRKDNRHDRLSGVISKLCMQAPSRERPSRQLARAEIDQQVQQALAQLEPEERELLLLHHVDGESAADIARARGLKPNTVVQQLGRARQRVMKLYLAAKVG